MIGWPLDRNQIRMGSINNTFGPVRNGGKRNHQGWDLEALIGTPCFAVADGRVAMIYTSKDYGLVLVLEFRHEDRQMFAAYAHLQSVKVSEGQHVLRGDPVGLTGESGNAKGMSEPNQHLHFELRTVARPGIGLAGRLSPLKIFGVCPLNEAVAR